MLEMEFDAGERVWEDTRCEGLLGQRPIIGYQSEPMIKDWGG